MKLIETKLDVVFAVALMILIGVVFICAALIGIGLVLHLIGII